MPQAITPNVYVPNKGAYDFSKAERFGNLVFCTEGLVLAPNDLNKMKLAIDNALLDADEQDFIILTSMHSLCSILCATFAHRFGRLNLLIYHRGDYLEKFLSFH